MGMYAGPSVISWSVDSVGCAASVGLSLDPLAVGRVTIKPGTDMRDLMQRLRLTLYGPIVFWLAES